MRSLIARHWPLVLLLAVAGALYARTLDAFGMFNWDEAEYACIARSLLRGDGFAIAGEPNFYRLPVLPLAAAASIAIAGRPDDAVLKRASIVFALLALVVIYAAVAPDHGRGTGLLAAAILAVLPGFWILTAQLLTEMPFLGAFAAASFALRRALDSDPRYFILAALFAALALLTRYTGMLLAPAGVLIAAAALVSSHGRIVFPSVRYVALGTALALLILLPWLLRQQLSFGDALIGFRYASGQLDAYLPGVVMPWHFYWSGLPRLVTLPGALLAAAGAAWALASRDRVGLTSLIVVVFLFVWFGLYRYKEMRLVTAALPFLAVLIALGLTRAIPARRPVRATVVVVGFAVVAGIGWRTAVTELRSVVTLGYPSFLDAMASLRRDTSPGVRVVGTAGPQISWYADRAARPYPAAPALPALIGDTAWFVITNFERGQQAYVGALAKQVTLIDIAAGRARRFSDARGFQTMLIRPELMRELLQRRAASS